MNKKELIEKYKKLEEDSFDIGALVVCQLILKDLEQLDEPKKVTIPQFVADWIEECKNDDFHLFGAMEAISLNQKKLDYWFREDDNMELFARAWIDGYEKEKRYLVRIIGITNYNSYLNYHKGEDKWTIESRVEIDAIRTEHTRKELEEAGFGEVFNSSLFEVVEVTE